MNPTELRVALRADASPRLGLGHVKRILALGEALLDAGAQVCMVSRPLGIDVAALAARAGVEFLPLRSNDGLTVAHDEHPSHASRQTGWAADARDTVAALRSWRARRVVVDDYGLDARWHRAVGAALELPVAAIDDLGDRDLHVDWLVDHNHSSDPHGKYASRLSKGAKMLAGPRYALLTRAYASAQRCRPQPEVESIGVFMGGTDAAGLSSVVLRACREEARFQGEIEVVTTSANPDLATLSEACARWPGTTLTVDAADLAAFFARHDLQIGAGGGATWERCCIGAPMLVLSAASNQQAVIPPLAQLGALATPNPADAVDEQTIGRAVTSLLHDPERRFEMARRARQLVDGLGARRVALCLAAAALTLRPARLDDGVLMHRWRNDPATRRVSGDSGEIDLHEHLRWLDSTLADSQRTLLVAVVGSIPVGVIRFDRLASSTARVSLYTDPALHGLGLGSAMLDAGERLMCQSSMGVRGFEAIVLPGNTPSERMFMSAGYVKNGQCWTKTTGRAS